MRAFLRAGCGNEVLVEPLRHRQTNAVGTDISDLRPSCHISAPQKAEEQDRREGDPGGPGHDAGRVRRSLRIQRQYAVPLGTRLATAGRADTRLSSRDRARPEGSAEGFAGCDAFAIYAKTAVRKYLRAPVRWQDLCSSLPEFVAA